MVSSGFFNGLKHKYYSLLILLNMKKIFLVFILFLSSCFYANRVSYLPSKIIYIDPGHGGKDNGCVFANVYEDDINLAIASYLFELFLNSNYISYITRSDDYDLASLYAKNRKNEDLKKRVKYINESKADLFISIHLNYYESPSVYGPMVYYQKNNDSSKLLANLIQNGLNIFTNTNKITHSGDYYLLNKTNVTGVIVECGFLSNIEERNKLMDSSYQYDLAKTIYDSVREYLM